jgi:HSP90 family molecular chaperone
MAGEIELWCILKSDPLPQSIFRVSIHGNKLVEDLREAIKAKKQAALANVDASDLHVWKVCSQDHTLHACLVMT